MPATPGSFIANNSFQPDDEVPIIDDSEAFPDVVKKLSGYFERAIDSAYTYEQLRTTSAGHNLKALVASLTEECHHTAIVSALLASKWYFMSIEEDGTGLRESRGHACEIVAWQFLTFLSEKELMDYLLYDLPVKRDEEPRSYESPHSNGSEEADETTTLIRKRPSQQSFRPPQRDVAADASEEQLALERTPPDEVDFYTSFEGLNALEIAAVANAKKFLSQSLVQKVVEEIWNGKIPWLTHWISPRIQSPDLADMCL